MLVVLLQKAKEILTESNIPHGSCVICLYGFKVCHHRKLSQNADSNLSAVCSCSCVCVCLQEGETFTKTNCYHYFHCHCLGRYVSHSESELRQREKELEEDKTRDRADDEVRHQRPEELCSEKSPF